VSKLVIYKLHEVDSAGYAGEEAYYFDRNKAQEEFNLRLETIPSEVIVAEEKDLDGKMPVEITTYCQSKGVLAETCFLCWDSEEDHEVSPHNLQLIGIEVQ
jgi:hypothetical protein